MKVLYIRCKTTDIIQKNKEIQICICLFDKVIELIYMSKKMSAY